MSSGYRFRHRTRWQIAMRYSGFPTATRAVAWALSTWWKSDADGSDEPPSIEDLAEASGLSRATVARAMSVLREHGWLEQERGGGRGRRSIYRAVIPPGAEERMEAVLNRRRGGSGSARNRLMGETVWPQKPSQIRAQTVSSTEGAKHKTVSSPLTKSPLPLVPTKPVSGVCPDPT